MLTALLVLPALMTPAAAHHSVLAFDNGRGVTLRGVVANLHWADPHTYLAIAVRRRNGGEDRWRIESESAIVLRRLGWTPEMIGAGTPVVIAGAAARDGTRVLRCDTVTPKGSAPLRCYP